MRFPATASRSRTARSSATSRSTFARVIALEPELAGQLAADVAAGGAGARDDAREIVARFPAELGARLGVVVDPIDRRRHSPPKPIVDLAPAGDPATDRGRRIAAQLGAV